MSKPSQKKATRQIRRSKQKIQHQKIWKQTQSEAAITPDTQAERTGAPVAGAHWVGQKLSSLLKPPRPR